MPFKLKQHHGLALKILSLESSARTLLHLVAQTPAVPRWSAMFLICFANPSLKYQTVLNFQYLIILIYKKDSLPCLLLKQTFRKLEAQQAIRVSCLTYLSDQGLFKNHIMDKYTDTNAAFPFSRFVKSRSLNSP